jgi:hypothetical protein
VATGCDALPPGGQLQARLEAGPTRAGWEVGLGATPGFFGIASVDVTLPRAE